jgi:hypothetical protein
MGQSRHRLMASRHLIVRLVQAKRKKSFSQHREVVTEAKVKKCSLLIGKSQEIIARERI